MNNSLNDLSNKNTFIWLAVITATAFLIRLKGIFTDFWLDEIWSFYFANMSSAPKEIINLRHDNNHLLNTLFLYYIGIQKHWQIYRIPALISGSCSVALLGFMRAQRDKTEGVIAAWLIGFSYFFILYSSEARGYAMAIFFSLLAFYAVDRYQKKGEAYTIAIFVLSVVLGLLAHFTFLYFYLSILLWHGFKFIKAGERKKLFFEMVKFHCVPLPFTLLLYFNNIRSMNIGGGPIYPLREVIPSTISLTLGGPEHGLGAQLICGLVALITLYEIYKLWQEGSDLWIFYLAIVLIVPAAILIVMKPTFVYPRYFVISVPFVLILCCRLLTRLHHAGRAPRILALLLLALFFVGNSIRVAAFLNDGRGHYLEAVKYIAAASGDKKTITVGSDQDFRNNLVLNFYSSYLPLEKNIKYVKLDAWTPDEPEWVIRHTLTVGQQPQPSFTGKNRVRYELQKSYPYSGISGFNWFVYRRAEPAPR